MGSIGQHQAELQTSGAHPRNEPEKNPRQPWDQRWRSEVEWRGGWGESIIGTKLADI